MKKIVIIGGGFSGINFAQSISNSADIQVTLVDKNNYNYFHPLLYQVATGLLNISSISTPFRTLLRGKTNVQFRLAEFIRVLPGENKVELSNGFLDYDYLILAVGTKVNFYGNKTIEEQSYPMKNLAQAIDLRNKLLKMSEDASISRNREEIKQYKNIVITGGGPSGVEVAGMLAELKTTSLPRTYPELNENLLSIYLIESSDTLLKGMSKKSQEYAIRSLEEIGVKLMFKTLVKDYRNNQVILSNGEKIDSKILIWTAGVQNPKIEGLSEDVYHKSGRIYVDNINLVKGTQNIFAIGDISMQTHQEHFEIGYPQLASVATQQGQTLGRNLNRMVNNQVPKPFEYFDKGTMAIIGKSKATADLKFPKRTVTGWLAWAAWLLIHLFLLINYRNRVKTMWEWTTSYFFRTHVEGLLVIKDDEDKSENQIA